jgi:hypothetical protein
MMDGMIDIALDDGQSCFEDLHDYADEGGFVAGLQRLARNTSGYVANTIVDLLCESEEGDSREPPRAVRESYVASARGCFGRSGAYAEHHSAFATIYAAGVQLLIETEFVPWTMSELEESILICEAAAIRTAGKGR